MAVNAGPEFTRHPEVISGASDLLVEIFADKGRHTRFAVGASSLPMNASVEVVAAFQIVTSNHPDITRWPRRDGACAVALLHVDAANVRDRHIDVFFYCLYMDASILSEGGATPENPRRAYVADFALRIGQRATLVPSRQTRAFGMLYALSHSVVERLYAAPGLINISQKQC